MKGVLRMSLEGKNKKLFSYNGIDKTGSNFMYKDFEKTSSYNSCFKQANFNFASLRGAKMKFCDFTQASFVGSEFVGTNFRGSNFNGAHFEDAIFWCSVLDKTNFERASFERCYFIGTGTSKARKFPADTTGITFLSKLPPVSDFSSALLQVVQDLRMNDIIRRSHTLHLKGGRVNTLTLQILLMDYSEDTLITLLPQIPPLLTSQFYTLSYLKTLLKKVG